MDTPEREQRSGLFTTRTHEIQDHLGQNHRVFITQKPLGDRQIGMLHNPESPVYEFLPGFLEVFEESFNDVHANPQARNAVVGPGGVIDTMDDTIALLQDPNTLHVEGFATYRRRMMALPGGEPELLLFGNGAGFRHSLRERRILNPFVQKIVEAVHPSIFSVMTVLKQVYRPLEKIAQDTGYNYNPREGNPLTIDSPYVELGRQVIRSTAQTPETGDRLASQIGANLVMKSDTTSISRRTVARHSDPFLDQLLQNPGDYLVILSTLPRLTPRIHMLASSS